MVNIFSNYKFAASFFCPLEDWTWHYEHSILIRVQKFLELFSLLPFHWKRTERAALSDTVVFYFLEIQEGAGKYFSHNAIRVQASFFCVFSFLSWARNCIVIFSFFFFNLIYYQVP